MPSVCHCSKKLPKTRRSSQATTKLSDIQRHNNFGSSVFFFWFIVQRHGCMVKSHAGRPSSDSMKICKMAIRFLERPTVLIENGSRPPALKFHTSGCIAQSWGNIETTLNPRNKAQEVSLAHDERLHTLIPPAVKIHNTGYVMGWLFLFRPNLRKRKTRRKMVLACEEW